jgi:cell division protease FtsH
MFSFCVNFLLLFASYATCYKFRHNIRFEPSHLDKKNIENLEKMFYIKNSRYHPARSSIFKKYNIDNNVTVNPNTINITEILKKVNDEFMEAFNEDLDTYNGELAESEYENKNTEDNTDDNEQPLYRYNDKNLGTRIIISNGNGYGNNNQPTGLGETNGGTFEIIRNNYFTFRNIGGYEKVKDELMQTSDILLNYSKYRKYNVRTPKGIRFEGPPGNGKTILAKAFSGELNISFIPVSGSEFAEKYVGVGASRVRELFQMADQNKPCIVFIDEIDAIGRRRGNDDSSSSEKDQTLNQLLISLDGFKESDGVFIIGATNRVDLLDAALTRPGRIDKQIYIGNPDSETRKEIIDIHIEGKPIQSEINIDDLVESTGGFSGAQIENLLNEAMLYALRENREMICKSDIEYIMNRIYAGWQTKENKFSDDIIERIVIHEMGHAIVGFLSRNHSRLSKIVLNLWSPKTPGYTIFENSDEDTNIYTKNGLFTHLMVLLAGRIAEEVYFGYSVTTGARQDLEQAFALAKNMIINYGMGKQNIYPDMSDHSKYLIDQEVNKLLMLANDSARDIILRSKNLVTDCAEILKRDKILKPEQIVNIIDEKYPEIWNLYNVKEIYNNA